MGQYKQWVTIGLATAIAVVIVSLAFWKANIVTLLDTNGSHRQSSFSSSPSSSSITTVHRPWQPLRQKVATVPHKTSLSEYQHPVPELWLPNASHAASPEGHSVTLDDLPIPLQVLEEYKALHGVEQLQREDAKSLRERNYAIVFYSCPLQAGNRLHHYLTGMMWSILTNRTMLYKYWDHETCDQYGAEFSLSICESANTVAGCDAILSRAPWIPSYDEWKDLLETSFDRPLEPLELPFYSTHPTSVVNSRYPWGPGNDESSFGVDVKFQQESLVIFAQTRFKFSFLKDVEHRQILLHSKWARDTAKKLYSLGTDFMFGALQRYSFDLTEHIRESIPKSDPMSLSNSDSYSVALHSRHIDVELDGCDISREIKCMSKLLKHKDDRKPCRVALMSDRQCTITRLSNWLQDHDCVPEVASHETRADYLSEHGPFAGAGFFQDLALASTVRSAFVGMRRSSSDLVLELIEFNRKMDLWRADFDLTTLPDMDKCMLEKIPPPGQAMKQGLRERRHDDTPPSWLVTDLQSLESGCNCRNNNASLVCCERVIRRTHKMGYELTGKLFDKVSNIEISPVFRDAVPNVDYRDVIITRDWYEAIISGKNLLPPFFAVFYRKDLNP